MRPPVISDYRFVYECFQDWPLGNKGPITEQKAVDFVRRWMFRDDEQCRIFVEGEPVGLMSYRPGVVDNIVVHPDHRGKGYSSKMMALLQTELVARGVTEMTFDAIPGVISDKIERTFEKVSEGVGEHTGLPIITGRVTAETKL